MNNIVGYTYFDIMMCNSSICSCESQPFTCIECFLWLFRIVSEVVRKALQAQKSGAEEGTATAEDSLHTKKQFTDIISLLPAMVSLI